MGKKRMKHDQVKSCKHKVWISQVTAFRIVTNSTSNDILKIYQRKECNKNMFKQNNTWIFYKVYHVAIVEMTKALKAIIISLWSTAYHLTKSVFGDGNSTDE